MMRRAAVTRDVVSTVIAVVGTGIAFAFLQAGAFADMGAGTLQRMVAGPGLRAAGLGAGVTALLLAPVLAWKYWRDHRGGAR